MQFQLPNASTSTLFCRIKKICFFYYIILNYTVNPCPMTTKWHKRLFLEQKSRLRCFFNISQTMIYQNQREYPRSCFRMAGYSLFIILLFSQILFADYDVDSISTTVSEAGFQRHFARPPLALCNPPIQNSSCFSNAQSTSPFNT